MPAACESLPVTPAIAPAAVKGLPGAPTTPSAAVSGNATTSTPQNAGGAVPTADAAQFVQALANAAAPPEALETLTGGTASETAGAPQPSAAPSSAKDSTQVDDVAQWLAALLPGFGAPANTLPPEPLPAPAGGHADNEPTRGTAVQGSAAHGSVDAATWLTAALGSTADKNAIHATADGESTPVTPPTGMQTSALELFALLERPSADSAASGAMQGAPSDGSAAATAGAQPQAPASALPDLAQNAALTAFHAAAVPHANGVQPNAEATINARVGTPAFADEIGGHVTWMAQQGSEAASLTVSPADLGPIEVRISVHAGQASVWFGAAHSETRTALEQALPRLRELFAAQGMSLADSGVYREAPRQFTPSAQVSKPLGSSGDEPAAQSVTAVTRTRLGLLDLYA